MVRLQACFPEDQLTLPFGPKKCLHLRRFGVGTDLGRTGRYTVKRKDYRKWTPPAPQNAGSVLPSVEYRENVAFHRPHFSAYWFRLLPPRQLLLSPEIPDR